MPGTSNGHQVYLGVGDLGVNTLSDRQQAFFSWNQPNGGCFPFSLTFDAVADTLSVTGNEPPLVIPTLTIPDVSAAITTKASGPPLSLIAPSADWNILVILVQNAVGSPAVDLIDVTLSAADGTNAVNLGDFCVNQGLSQWTIKNYDFSAGFQIVGTIVRGSGTFSSSQEANKVELSIMKEIPCAPAPAPIPP
jgi:hypothetical protein